MAKRITIDAARLAGKVSDVESQALSASDCRDLPIVMVSESGYIDIIDGYHRIAGMILAGETMIPCIDCDDANLCGIAANAEDSESQAEAIAKIYSIIS